MLACFQAQSAVTAIPTAVVQEQEYAMQTQRHRLCLTVPAACSVYALHCRSWSTHPLTTTHLAS